MTMRTVKLTVYWDSDEAYCVIELLDQLRDKLCAQYAKDIRRMLKESGAQGIQGDGHLQMTFPFNDPTPF